MPLIVKCKSCGFVLYNRNDIKSLYDVLKSWGFRCPCCLSPLPEKSIKIITYKFYETIIHIDTDNVHEVVELSVNHNHHVISSYADISKYINYDEFVEFIVKYLRENNKICENVGTLLRKYLKSKGINVVITNETDVINNNVAVILRNKLRKDKTIIFLGNTTICLREEYEKIVKQNKEKKYEFYKLSCNS